MPTLTRFDLVRTIGEGGAGIVYEAIDRTSGERVALKTLRVRGAEALLRFKEEFRALQDLEHPNLVRLGELTSSDGTWFFTMELIEGVSFLEWVSSDRGDTVSGSHPREAAPPVKRPSIRPDGAPRTLDERRLRSAILQLARGLIALHAAGKIHRDVKPSNVLVDRTGRVVILDFGLVRDAGSIGEDEGIVGTVPYMAPEQAAGEQLGPAADWYSVGSVLYECLTGRHPFEGTAGDVLHRKQIENPVAPSIIAPDVPGDLNALCMHLLARESSQRPDGDEVLRKLEARAPSMRPRLSPSMSPFIGRRPELDVLEQSFAEIRRGLPATVVIEGEAGIGKSALVRRFARSLPAMERRTVVLSGRCYEREDVPYKAIDGVVDALANHLVTQSRSRVDALLPPGAAVLAQVFPVLLGVDAIAELPPMRASLQESRALFYDALRALLTNIARRRPLVVVVDDMHWADADSLSLLHDVLRPPFAPPLLLVVTARATKEKRTANAPPFGLPADARVLPLARLSREEGMELLGVLARDVDPVLAERIAAEADGHPLFIDELVRHARASVGAVESVRLDDALVDRVARLDSESRALLETLSVAGIALPQRVAMRATGLSFGAFAKHAHTLRAAHLARSDGWRGADVIEPYHDRVRDAVAARLAPPARRLGHAALARAMEAEERADPDALATHWLAAGETEKAARYAVVAADRAFAALAFERAADRYARALSIGALDETTRQRMRVRRAEALANAGHGRDAAGAFSEAAGNAPPEEALDLRRRAAEELLSAGLLAEGDDALRAVLGAVGLALPTSPLAALLGLLFFRLILVLRGLSYRERAEGTISAAERVRVDACAGAGRMLSVVDTIRGAYFQSRATCEALALGEPTRAALALSFEASYVSAAGPRRGARAARLNAEAETVARRSGQPNAIAMTQVTRGYALFCQGNFDASLRECDAGAAILREKSPAAFWDMRTAMMGSIWSLCWKGELGELATRCERGLREAEQRGDLFAATTLRTGLPNLVSLRLGDVATARALVAEAALQWSQRGYHNQHYWTLLALAHADLYEQDGRAAYERITRDWPKITRALLRQVQLMDLEAVHLRARAALVAAARENGSARASLFRAAARDGRALRRAGTDIGVALADAIAAGVASVRGNAEGAALALERAERGFTLVSMSLHANAARWQLGTLHAGDEGAARVASAAEWLRARGVVDPPSMARLMVPVPARGL